ncbi:Crp/Fnr family transcriptional regulator [Myroides injenensis]|uniref:Crp/Fnr family transcriptional regulator n=1 Tax=Myroides injenensis TaxID=1183151 RepID=UPI00028963CE|nr:Crp/Fnr family transcriptional regulator [Myroides injenensis]
MNEFIKQLLTYYPLSSQTLEELTNICTLKHFKKNELLLSIGDHAHYYYFIQKGLLGYYNMDDEGNIIYKLFFEEHSFVTSTSAVIENKPSDFSIIALEDTEVICYPVIDFQSLLIKHHDLALFQIRYLEKNWVVKKEPLEINLKWESAKKRYIRLYQNKKLYQRLKKHQIASYLGVTPTQLSRIRKELNY